MILAERRENIHTQLTGRMDGKVHGQQKGEKQDRVHIGYSVRDCEGGCQVGTKKVLARFPYLVYNL